jgi:hypothetical protein
MPQGETPDTQTQNTTIPRESMETLITLGKVGIGLGIAAMTALVAKQIITDTEVHVGSQYHAGIHADPLLLNPVEDSDDIESMQSVEGETSTPKQEVVLECQSCKRERECVIQVVANQIRDDGEEHAHALKLINPNEIKIDVPVIVKASEKTGKLQNHPSVAAAEQGLVSVRLRERSAIYLGQKVRMELSSPSYTVANRQIAAKRLTNIMEKMHVRGVDMVRMVPYAIGAVFTPTREEIKQRLFESSVEVQQMREDASAPIWQRRNTLPAWVQARVPDWMNHLPFCSEWIRSDQVPLE